MSDSKQTPEFESINEAFNYCREKDHPVTIIVVDTVQGYYGTYKLYPSGRADQLKRCLCMSLDNHMLCPTHGEPEWVDWEAEKRARLITTAPDGLALAEHILALETDPYLQGHPEWEAFLNEAKALVNKAGVR